MSFEEFLELPEHERFEYLTSIKLSCWQKLYIKFLNKWWSCWRNEFPNVKGYILLESIRKGRF